MTSHVINHAFSRHEEERIITEFLRDITMAREQHRLVSQPLAQ